MTRGHGRRVEGKRLDVRRLLAVAERDVRREAIVGRRIPNPANGAGDLGLQVPESLDRWPDQAGPEHPGARRGGECPQALQPQFQPVAAGGGLYDCMGLARGVRLFDTSEVCVLMSATPGGGDDFMPADHRERRLAQVMPHWARAARMQHRNFELSGLASLGLAGLDTLDFGVMVLQADMRVRYANSWAESLVQADANRLRVDLDQLGQRVLRPAGDRHRPAQTDVQVRKFGPRQRAGAVHTGPGLVDNQVLRLPPAFDPAGSFQAADQLGNQLLGSRQLTGHQEISIQRELATAYLALSREDLAVQAFAQALQKQPDLELDSVRTSPRVLKALETAKKAHKSAPGKSARGN